MAALISRASGVDPYFVGKIVFGIEAGLETFLVLTGVTDRSEAESYPYLPHHIIDSVSDLIPKLPAIA